ncbi:Homeobox Protein Hox-D3 [Manis pentadactyla]|nr:Homeobox Protein Hox-D3 [Manis pentadactyla]
MAIRLGALSVPAPQQQLPRAALEASCIPTQPCPGPAAPTHAKPGFPWRVCRVQLGKSRPLRAPAARRCPGLELSPVTEKIIKHRARRRPLSAPLRIQLVRISGSPDWRRRSAQALGPGGEE